MGLPPGILQSGIDFFAEEAGSALAIGECLNKNF
jgi:hypothetical protein